MLLKLDDHYAKFTNNISEHEVCGETLEEVFRVLCNRYPQLLIHLHENNAEICKKSGIKLDGEFVTSESANTEKVSLNSVIELTLIIPHGNDKTVKFIVGAVLIVAGAVLMGFGQAWGSYLIQAGVSLMITTAVMEAFFTPDMPNITNSLLYNSASYTFDGIKNTTATGTPIQLVYGEHRVGGQVLNLYSTVEESTELIEGEDTKVSNSYVYSQIGICEGPVVSVSDIHINQLPISFYNEVTTYPTADLLRTGEESQSIMLYFDQTANTTSINRKILNIEDNLTDIPIEFSAYTPVYGYVGVLEYKQRFKPCKLGMYKPAEFDDGYSTTD